MSLTCRNCKHNVLLEDYGEQYSWCEIDDDNYDIDEPRECTMFKPATNAEKVRAMTDEELAKYLWAVEHHEITMPVEEWLEWLKQEVRE